MPESKPPSESPEANAQPLFVTTRWSVVLRAGRSDTTRAQAALAELCQAYWYPLYAYARRHGFDPHDAEDATQGFFEKLLKLRSLAGVEQAKGRFRAFMLASMKNYLADERDHASAQKRNRARTISLDAQAAEERYQFEPVERVTPEQLFERRWALTLLDAVMLRLSAEYESSGRGAMFAALRFAITGDKSAVPYTELAAELGMSGEAVRGAVHRLRKRYRLVLREEIGHTVADESEIADELNSLRRILSA
ncbi:MAG TPA: sigma-70 family RNA polymerase sigma factor [Chthoniobacteraceae bacterium]|nr:sigma-70 family RNA polymerase sigma factor [Chthoniobacteraceae bacterium]